MDNGKLLTDDYLMNLLNEDARTAKYGSLLSQKRDRNAPKPNTRFLRNIIRDTDSHNAALLAKEQEESRAKRRELEREERRKREDGERGVKRKREEGRPNRWASALGGLGRRMDERKGDRTVEKREYDHDRGVGRRESSRDKRSGRSEHQDNRPHRRWRSRSRDSHASPSRRVQSGKHRKHDVEERRPRSPLRKHKRHRRRELQIEEPRSEVRPKDAETAEESDPLEDMLGPAPPPKTRPRGRGARSNQTSNIDLRFNDPSYDPRADVDLDPDNAEDGGDWDTALEVIRDRAKWRAQGAERLRAAGFGEQDVERWEGSGREKDERDVKWKGRGETKEWDEGKILDGNGEFGVKAAWTLKSV